MVNNIILFLEYQITKLLGTFLHSCNENSYYSGLATVCVFESFLTPIIIRFLFSGTWISYLEYLLLFSHFKGQHAFLNQKRANFLVLESNI